MSAVSPPLRFLALVLGGWVCVRAAVLGSAWWQEERPEAKAPGSAPRPLFVDRKEPAPGPPEPAPLPFLVLSAPAAAPPIEGLPSARAAPLLHQTVVPLPMTPSAASAAPVATAAPILSPPPERRSRWAASAWLFVRDGGSPALAPGGMLGGSQAGARVSYRLNGDPRRPLAVSARTYAPLDNHRAAEAAIGLDWKPLAGLPLHLLAERRQKLGGEGRSAFSITAYGGVSDERVGPLRLDAYGQAGMVGLRSRDLFADGSARLSLPAGPVKIGAGAWGAAQPGVERLDLGPQASVRLPIGKGAAVIAADWRFRVAGSAAPRSGPALTLSTEF